MFLLIFVVDTKIFFGCNFGAPFTKPKKHKNEKIKNSEVTRKQLNNWKQKKMCIKKKYGITLELS